MLIRNDEMSKLVVATKNKVGQSESARMALLSASSFVLGLAFIALLVADEARAAF